MNSLFIDKFLTNLGKKCNSKTYISDNDVCQNDFSNNIGYKITDSDICKCEQKNIFEPLYDRNYNPKDYKTGGNNNHICGVEEDCSITDMFKQMQASFNNEKINYQLKSYLEPENFPFPELYDNNMEIGESLGGATAKQSVKKKMSNIHNSKNVIEEYGKLIIKELGNNFRSIGNKISEDDILTILTKIGQSNKEKYLNLNSGDIYFLLNYVKENYNKVALEKFYSNHALCSIMELKNSSLEEQLYQLNIFEDCINYNRLIEISRLVSDQFDDISSRGGPYGKILQFSTSKFMVDPLIAALFLIKLPALEELLIGEDYYSLIKDIRRKKTSRDNIMLFLLRLSDPMHLNIMGSSHKNSASSEIMRIAITQALRKVILDLRQGIFYSDVANNLITLLNKIITPSSKTEDENLLHSILETISFKPTLIKSSNMLYSDGLPKSVYNISYDISNTPLSNNIVATVSTESLDTMVYNPQTGRLSIYPHEKRNDGDTENVLLKKILLALKSSPDSVNVNSVAGPFATQRGFVFPENQNIKTSIIMSNGVYFISIPRLIKKTFDPFTQFKSTDKLNTYPITVENTIMIGNNLFELRSAVCYQIQDESLLFGLDMCPNQKPINKIALIKTKKGWFKYNPYFWISPNDQKEQFLRGLQNLFKSTLDPEDNMILEDDEFESRYKEWVKDERNKHLIELKLEQLNDGKFKVEDFYIGVDEAENYLKYYSTMLIYSENYESYYRNNSSVSTCCN